MRPIPLALGLALVLLARPALAATCLEDVRTLAEAESLSSKPPVATPAPVPGQAPGVASSRNLSRDLAKSGGVIAPPPTADNSVIKPPANTDPGMPTIPDKAPSAEAGKPGAAPDGNRTALQAALTAARHHAEEGDEKACRDSLAKAKQLAETR